MADNTYESGFRFLDDWESLDVRVLILNDGGTPNFNVRHSTLAEVLADPGNVEETGTRDKVVPTKTLSGATLDHGDVVYTTPAVANWLRAIYYVAASTDEDSTVLHFKDCVVTPTGTGNVTIATGAAGLVDLNKADQTLIRSVDLNRPYVSRIRHVDLNNWDAAHTALVPTAA